MSFIDSTRNIGPKIRAKKTKPVASPSINIDRKPTIIRIKGQPRSSNILLSSIVISSPF
jgi:hypothetical protein